MTLAIDPPGSTDDPCGHESSVRQLVGQINTRLRDSHATPSPRVHTFQHVSLADEYHHRDVLVWRTLSRNVHAYTTAVNTFIHFNDTTKTIERTLINNEWDMGPYWHSYVDGTITSAPADDYTFDEIFGASIAEDLKDEPLEEKLAIWSRCLAGISSRRCSAMWISQRLQRDPPMSLSAFVLFDHVVTSPLALFEISKVTRDFMITCAVAWYERAVRQAYEIQRQHFRELLNTLEQKEFIDAHTTDRLTDYMPFILSRLPFTILGPAGVGKTRIARVIHHLATVPAGVGGALADRTHSGNAPFTVYSPSRLNRMCAHGTSISTDEKDGQSTLVFTNIHRLTPDAFDILHEVIANTTNTATLIICTADVSFYQAVPEDLKIEIGVALLKMAPLENRRGDIPDLIEKMLSSIAAKYNGPQNISSECIQQLKGAPWPRNDGQLYATLLRSFMLEKHRDTITRVFFEQEDV